MPAQSTQTQTFPLPQHLQSLVFGYLHHPYDYERAQVIAELEERASLIPNDFEHVQYIPSLLMPTACQWRQIQKKYRKFCDDWAIVKCRCGMCRNSLYGNV